MGIFNSIFFFIIAIGILVAIHEYGHFWVARKMGVKVIRFSIGFGKVLWSFQRNPEATQYVVSAIPLGGYVKMVDEREGSVRPEDLPYAFNRQSVAARSAIVAAGPVFNLILAVVMFWGAAVIGETGFKPILGPVEPGTVAAKADLQEGDEIIRVDGKLTPIWSEALSRIFAQAMDGKTEIVLLTKTEDGTEQAKTIALSEQDTQSPEHLHETLGLTLWSPKLRPVIGTILPDGAAEKAGMQPGDLIISADDQSITDWLEWVKYVQAKPEQMINVLIERDGMQFSVSVIPELFLQEDKKIGKIGAAVLIPDGLMDEMSVLYRLSPLAALPDALDKTWFIATSSLNMLGKMILGKASVENLSGPISIAQYAGQTAGMGLVYFLKYLGLISVSLGILNLLPIPVLDGGHLLFFGIEAIKGSPIPEKIQLYVQQIGMFLLMALMSLVIFLDIERLFQ